ncbi:hypothetical protein PLIP_a3804 [Pseudoalteromonas lipolytica LMEB 39]|nr:hypothetical protein [Pseudoalteromonas lipolytica LMEB 39]
MPQLIPIFKELFMDYQSLLVTAIYLGSFYAGFISGNR